MEATTALIARPAPLVDPAGMVVVDLGFGRSLTCTPTAYAARWSGCPVIEVVPVRSDRRFCR